MKATCELLDVLDPSGEDFARILSYLIRQIDGLKAYQCNDGMWRQVIDDAGSYEETSCTVMFAGAIAHAVNKGWIGKKYAPMALKAWEKVKKSYIVNGRVQNVCVGTSLKDDENYYLGRPVSGNDAHATGATISTGLEIILLRKNNFIKKNTKSS